MADRRTCHLRALGGGHACGPRQYAPVVCAVGAPVFRGNWSLLLLAKAHRWLLAPTLERGALHPSELSPSTRNVHEDFHPVLLYHSFNPLETTSIDRFSLSDGIPDINPGVQWIKVSKPN